MDVRTIFLFMFIEVLLLELFGGGGVVNMDDFLIFLKEILL